MSTSCLYCAQTNTHKDEFGYCKRYNCFEVSGNKKKYEQLKNEISDSYKVNNYARNFLDGTHYNPRLQYIDTRIQAIQKFTNGIVPLEIIDLRESRKIWRTRTVWKQE